VVNTVERCGYVRFRDARFTAINVIMKAKVNSKNDINILFSTFIPLFIAITRVYLADNGAKCIIFFRKYQID
jgi:hypothetical protein